MLCGTAYGTPAPTITTTPTNGPTTITVHARTMDGKMPEGVECSFSPPVPPQRGYDPAFVMPRLPLFFGTNGNWTATNVPPGTHMVGLRTTNYVQDSRASTYLHVEARMNYTVDFVLPNGATFKGRVLDAVTGKPIARAVGYGETGARLHDLCTDPEGRYELTHIAGTLRIEVQTTNYVAQVFQLDAAAEGSTVTVPDIRLSHGGWISGRVERPAVLTNAFAMVSPEIQGGVPANSLIREAYVRSDGTFRTDPVPPGIYTLNVECENGGKGVPQTWRATGSISNIIVIAGQDTANVLIPTKIIVHTNSPSGR